MTPLVSVVMPMRNAEPFVLAALASVLDERTVPLEVVVIDDGSTDRSRALVESVADSRIRLVSGPQRGIAACLNTGLQAARGAVVMRCDADDLYPPGRIREQLLWLDAHPQHGAVCGPFSTMDRAGRLIAQLGSEDAPAADIEAELRAGITRTSLCTFAIRRAVLDSVGLFREYFETAEDIDFLLRVGEACQVGYENHNRYMYRLHQASITHVQTSERRLFFDRMSRDFQLQRREHGVDDLQRGCPPAPPDAAVSATQSAAQHVQGMLVGQAWRLFQQKRRGPALRVMLRAVGARPVDTGAWMALLALSWRSLTQRGR